MSHRRNRVWNIGLVGEEKFQREIIKCIGNRNLQDKEKILKKMDNNPSNFVMNNLSNGIEPVLSIVKTPGNVKYMRNIITGCFVSDYLIFLVDATTREKIFQQIEEYSIWQLVRYFKKQIAFVFLDENFEEFKSAAMPDGRIYSTDEQEDIKSDVKEYLESKKAFTNPMFFFLKNRAED